MLEGKTVNLRLMEREDLRLFTQWVNDPEFYGKFIRLRQRSKVDIEKQYDSLSPETKWFLIEKKDQGKMGT